jgi:hypothetical protein
MVTFITNALTHCHVNFGVGKKKLIWGTKVTKNRMYTPPFSTICINKFFHGMIKVDKHSINEFWLKSKIWFIFHESNPIWINLNFDIEN